MIKVKIYIVKQTIEVIQGHELEKNVTNLYGAYKNEEDAKKKRSNRQNNEKRTGSIFKACACR